MEQRPPPDLEALRQRARRYQPLPKLAGLATPEHLEVDVRICDLVEGDAEEGDAPPGRKWTPIIDACCRESMRNVRAYVPDTAAPEYVRTWLGRMGS